MSESVPAYRWSAEGFLRAFEAGAFDSRVELVNGEVWPVVIGEWHGEVTFRLGAALRAPGVRVTGSTLVSGESFPDPDCWVRREAATPLVAVGSKLNRWDPADVVLVAEVSDETMLADLTVKAALYATAGYAQYWVVTREAVFVHTEPSADGYGNRRQFSSGTEVPVPYTDLLVDVAELIAP